MIESLRALCGLFECVVALAVGYHLKASGVLRVSDGQAALILAQFTTLPSVILQGCSQLRPIPQDVVLGSVCLPLAVLVSSVIGSWVTTASRHLKDRALLTGCCAGWSVSTIGYALADAIWGYAAVPVASLVHLVDWAAGLCVGYTAFAKAGPAFPVDYKHEDGGTYRGEWRAVRKEGLGVYKYKSGARYEGEWRANVKDGRGVYFYPKGGTYEGEWSGGLMNGLGVRTYSTGDVKAGMWKDGQLEKALDLKYCTIAVEGAAEAAAAAKRVPVGGGQWSDMIQHFATHPPAWAVVAGLAMAWCNQPLPQWLDGVTATLAPANRGLVLLALGASFSATPPTQAQVADVAHVMAWRIGPALLLGAAALAACCVWPCVLDSGAVLLALLLTLTPPPLSAVAFSRLFRLREGVVPALMAAGSAASAGLLLLLLPLVAAGLRAGRGEAAAEGASSSGLLILAAVCALLGAAVVVGKAVFAPFGQTLAVRMIYAPAAARTEPRRGSSGGNQGGQLSALPCSEPSWRPRRGLPFQRNIGIGMRVCAARHACCAHLRHACML